MILDGVVDPVEWATHGVISNIPAMEPAAYSLFQLLHYSLVDTEKVYSGLTDGCAKAGRAGCKLIEITGDNATGEDVKALLNNALDVIDLLP